MKKVLIVTYYWPPAGGPGVQRWLSFVKYLPENGIQPVLYVPENPHYPIKDESLTREVPAGIKIYKRRIWEPYNLAFRFSKRKAKDISAGILPKAKTSLKDKILLWIRGNLFIPDARKYWVAPSVSYLNEILEKEGIDTVITTGPPHSMHLIGMGLKKKRQLRWIADFRDPWTSIGYHSALRLTRGSEKKHLALEKMVLNTADEILVTSNITGREFEKLTKRPITVITNGYEGQAEKNVELHPYFSISHIGSLLSDRNPRVLWKVLSDLAREHQDFGKALKIRLIGVVSNEVVQDIRKVGLGEALELIPYIPHGDAIAEQRKARVLLLAEINAGITQGIIPGKLFEYMAARRPVLAIGPEGWEAGNLVVETGSGRVFTYTMEQELKQTIWEWYGDFKKGVQSIPSQDIEQFSRRALTGKLAKRILWA